MLTDHTRAEHAAWLLKNRRQMIDALALALRVQPGDILRRLGVHLRDLVIPEQVIQPRPKRQRGRPRRAVDRERVLASLRKHCGRHRPVAKETAIPRSTLSRYLSTVPSHAWRYGEKISERHGELLAKSGVSVDVARARGYMSAPTGLVVPIWNERGVEPAPVLWTPRI